MRNIVPSQQLTKRTEKFPLEETVAMQYGTILAMELYGCALSEVARCLDMSVDQIKEICLTPDYMNIKNRAIHSIRELDKQTLVGRMASEADDAFERMRDLAESAKREDVKFNANKDLMDRAFVNSAIQAGSLSDELRITIVKRN